MFGFGGNPPPPPHQLLCGQEECVQCLLEQEASVLLGDARGRTSIHLAAARGYASWLSELLSIACSEPPLPPLRDLQGYTPLHWACYYGESTPDTATAAAGISASL